MHVAGLHQRGPGCREAGGGRESGARRPSVFPASLFRPKSTWGPDGDAVNSAAFLGTLS